MTLAWLRKSKDDQLSEERVWIASSQELDLYNMLVEASWKVLPLYCNVEDNCLTYNLMIKDENN